VAKGRDEPMQKYNHLHSFFLKKTNNLLKNQESGTFAPQYPGTYMINRKISPPIQEIRQLRLPAPQCIRLDNGIPLYMLDFPGQEIVKIEAIFFAGRPEEHRKLVSKATARLLRDGTRSRSGAEIAEHFDFYGAGLSIPSNLDTASISTFSLKKYLDHLIPVFAEVLRQPAFPEAELENFQRTGIQDMLVELEKVEVLAYRQITEMIFGAEHPYGYNSNIGDYESLQRSDLEQHFQRWYTPANGLLFAAGRIDDQVIRQLNQHLGQEPFRGERSVVRLPEPQQRPETIHLKQPGSLQTAIKIGRRSFSRTHPDANGFFVLNTLLGGYFGSRLMMNIREKKGFTYNIYSSNDSYLYDGCFYISTEVNANKTKATIREIFAEMQRLCEDDVPDSELEMVRNYLLGMLLNGLDGPLNTADVVRSLLVENLPMSTYDDLVQSIRDITPGDIRSLAQKYFRPEDFWIVTVGK
jgi:zinc protease